MGTGTGRRRPRAWRLLRVAVLAVLVLGLVFFGVGGWFYSGQIRDGALAAKPPAAPVLATEVLAVGGGSITLARDTGSPPELTTPGTWGLRWAGGYGRLGAIRSLAADRVERAFTRLQGTGPRPGERSAVDGYAWPADPAWPPAARRSRSPTPRRSARPRPGWSRGAATPG